MNFLSHYYFDRHSDNPQLVLGTVLPDLLKNARKDWNVRPEKRPWLFNTPAHSDIMTGWNRHLLVDRLFHNSSFFIEHSRSIRERIAPVFDRSPIRAFFVAHITLELMLDGFLIADGTVAATDLYEKLERIDRPAMKSFLKINQLDNIDHFITYFDRFIQSRYLGAYGELPNIVHAVSRICTRIWPLAMSPTQITALETLLCSSREDLQPEYPKIFSSITNQLA